MVEKAKKRAKSEKKAAVPAQDVDGGSAGRVGIRDIPERRQAEKALEESEERYRTIFDQAADAVFIHDKTGRIQDVNRKACQNLGFSREELLSMSIGDIDPEAIQAGKNRLWNAVLAGESFTFESRQKRKDDSLIPVEVTLGLIRLPHGPMVLGIARDISGRKQTEENLRSFSLRLEALLAAVPDIIMEVDTEKVYAWANPAGLEFFGEDVIGREAADYFIGEQETYALVKPLFDGREGVFYVESWQRRKDGEKRLLAWWCGVLKDAEGKVTGALSTARDITEHKRTEERIMKLNRTLAVVSDINQLIVRERDEQKLFEGACNLAVEKGGFLMSWIGLLNEGTGRIEPVAGAGAVGGYLEHFHITISDTPEGRGPTETAIREGRAVICNDIEHDECMIPWRERALALGYRSSAAFPLIVASKTIGSLNLYSGAAHFFNDEEVHLLEELVTDISYALESLEQERQRTRAEEALLESERKFRETVLNLDEGYYSVTPDGVLLEHNRAFCRILGFDGSADLKGKRTPDFWQRTDKRNEYLQELISKGSVSNFQADAKTVKGEKIIVLINAHIIKGKDDRPIRIEGIFQDITARVLAEEGVQASLREKEILLREIHHRVKNNMQVISSLFNLQAGHIKDEDARRMLKEGQLRIRSMALVHEKLYKSRDLSKIDFADYLQSLADHFFQFFQVRAGRIRLETDLEQIHLDVNSAVPCGLLVSELISNALKHAFPEGREGAVEIGLRRRKDGAVELQVSDDGVGFPDSMDFRRTESFGLQIAILLVGQLKGTIELDRKNGAAFTIVFSEENPRQNNEPGLRLPIRGQNR